MRNKKINVNLKKEKIYKNNVICQRLYDQEGKEV